MRRATQDEQIAMSGVRQESCFGVIGFPDNLRGKSWCPPKRDVIGRAERIDVIDDCGGAFRLMVFKIVKRLVGRRTHAKFNMACKHRCLARGESDVKELQVCPQRARDRQSRGKYTSVRLAAAGRNQNSLNHDGVHGLR